MTFRYAEPKDTPLILNFIRQLADYEHMLSQVVADEALLKEWSLTAKRQRSFLLWRMSNRWGLLCSSTTFPLS